MLVRKTILVGEREKKSIVKNQKSTEKRENIQGQDQGHLEQTPLNQVRFKKALRNITKYHLRRNFDHIYPM